MKPLKRSLGILFLLFAFLFTGCSLQTKDVGTGDTAYRQSAADYAKALDINSPEGLAQYASKSYMDMIARKADPREEFPALMEHSSKESQAQAEDALERFAQDIELSADYFESKNRTIEGYVYSETTYSGEDNATIYRIQIMDDGKLYYFKQDFVREDGTWKIRGDNTVNPFRLTASR